MTAKSGVYWSWNVCSRWVGPELLAVLALAFHALAFLALAFLARAPPSQAPSHTPVFECLVWRQGNAQYMGVGNAGGSGELWFRYHPTLPSPRANHRANHGSAADVEPSVPLQLCSTLL